MKIILIAAMSRNRVIGRGNQLPWHLPGDLKRFRAVTQGCPVIMGRKTFESIGRLLPKRLNVILSRDADACEDLVRTLVKDLPTDFEASESPVKIRGSVEQALSCLRLEPGLDRVYVLGGGQIYEQALPFADEIDLTEVDFEVSDGDTFFPAFENEFTEQSREPGYRRGQVGQPEESAEYDYVKYVR